MVNDFFSTLRTYLSKVTDGDTKATEVATAVNQWLREGGEALKVKIEDEVERSVSKMGFVKRGEFEALKEELARLKVDLKNEGAAKASPKKAETKASAAKKAAPKKTATKKAAEKKASK
jgi:BMFP domain-containing protein YqiC